jgi:hypothetical protein
VFGVRRRLAAFGSGFAEAFLRDNRVLPPVLALLALLVFAWIVAGIFVGGPGEDRQTLNEANLAQSEGDPGSDALAPEVENRNVESYAAYESKDPFLGGLEMQQLIAPAGETTATAPGTTTEDTTGETTTGPGGGGGGGGGGLDSDGDGLSDGRESELGLDPFNPDTDADGTLDGDEDTGGGGGGGRGGGGRGGLFDSGGDLRLP